MKTITQDTRPIRSAYGSEDAGYNVGFGKVTKIEAYDEMGKPWLAIYIGEEIIARVNCAMLESIEYERSESDG